MNNGRRDWDTAAGRENRPDWESIAQRARRRMGLPGETSRAARRLECENQTDRQAAKR
jgi:hypothetical protein